MNILLIILLIILFIVLAIFVFRYPYFKDNFVENSIIDNNINVIPPVELTEQQKASAIPLVVPERNVSINSSD
jgi:hypothetical protein